MPEIKIEIPGGIVKDVPQYTAGKRWVACNNFRFVEGKPRRIGGRTPINLTGDAITGVPMRVFYWNPSGTGQHILLGTTTGLFYINRLQNRVTDITPSDFNSDTPFENTQNMRWSFARYGQDVLCQGTRTPLYIFKHTSDTLHKVKDERHPTTNTPIATEVPQGSNMMAYNAVDGRILLAGANELDGSELSETEARGAFNARYVAWSSPDSYEFKPETTNGAGFLTMPEGDYISALQQDITGNILISTNKAMFLMSRTNDPQDAYALSLIGREIGAISQHSIINAGSTIYWMGNNGFYAWRGTDEKLHCPLEKHIFNERLENQSGADKRTIFAVHLPLDNEIRWHMPVRLSNQNYPNYYVCLNYRTGEWSEGFMDMTAWASDDDNQQEFPIGFSSSREMAHYEDFSQNATQFAASIESGPYELTDSEIVQMVREVIPNANHSDPDGTYEIKLTGRKYPSQPASKDVEKILEFGYDENGDRIEKKNTRISGKLINFKLDVPSTLTGEFELGTPRLEVVARGRR